MFRFDPILGLRAKDIATTTVTLSSFSLAAQNITVTNGVAPLSNSAVFLSVTSSSPTLSAVSNGLANTPYYIVNKTASDILIKHNNNIKIRGGEDMTLSPDQACQFVCLTPTTVAVF